jgi:hypothetical protein
MLLNVGDELAIILEIGDNMAINVEEGNERGILLVDYVHQFIYCTRFYKPMGD